GKPQYNNSYTYNAEDYNPNLEFQYLRARYYDVERGDFLTEDTYLGDITDPLTLNRYNYVKSSPLNYIDPSGHFFKIPESWLPPTKSNIMGVDDYTSLANDSNARRDWGK
ncbi:RHS repeat-associated core domain-containing protein, partial [Lacrimispora sp.]|uniref:RHS repeat-associated core domain-containing protein n=1 Tax=Lacrimispora sp. TaxID=2719234 RepID=UPI002FD9716D